MTTDKWFGIWTIMAAILIADTLLIRSARLDRRTRRFTRMQRELLTGLGIIAVCGLIGMGSVWLITHHGDHREWTGNRTLNTFPSKK